MSKKGKTLIEVFEEAGLLGTFPELKLEEETMSYDNLLWVAYCEDCRKRLDAAPNGALIEAKAKHHVKHEEDGKYWNHTVIVGYPIFHSIAYLHTRQESEPSSSSQSR